MNGREHQEAAERALAVAAGASISTDTSWIANQLGIAQVHATLALAATMRDVHEAAVQEP